MPGAASRSQWHAWDISMEELLWMHKSTVLSHFVDIEMNLLKQNL